MMPKTDIPIIADATGMDHDIINIAFAEIVSVSGTCFKELPIRMIMGIIAQIPKNIPKLLYDSPDCDAFFSERLAIIPTIQ